MPGGATLEVLHETLQSLFLWDNAHLYQFRSGDRTFAASADEGDDSDRVGNERLESCGETTIASLFSKTSDVLTYDYDLGDGWQVELECEQISPEANHPYELLPVCLGGERAAPPDDCGGTSGYSRLLEALADPRKPEHEERLQLLGRPWDPEGFDLNFANAYLESETTYYLAERMTAQLAPYRAEVIEQLEDGRPKFVQQTLTRLLEEGLEEEEALHFMAMAFKSEVEAAGGGAMSEKRYREALDSLPDESLFS